MPIHAHIPRCQHIKVNGLRCGSPALRGHDLCYFHNRTRREFGPELPGYLLPLSLESPEAIQMSLMKVTREIANGTLAPRLASLLLRALQIAVSNSRHLRFDTPAVRDYMVLSVPEPKPATPPRQTRNETLETPRRETRNEKLETLETPPRETRNQKLGTPLPSSSDLRVPRVLCGESSRESDLSDDPLIRELHDLTHTYLFPRPTERNNGNRRKGP